MKPDMSRIIQHIAVREGISEQEALNEMQRAIDEGYDSNDPAVQACWANLPFKRKPTPQELIAFMAGLAKGPELH